jgi:GNAT superfamily N-acetyltransferase
MAPTTATAVTIRRAGAADLPALADLRAHGARASFGRLGEKAVAHWLEVRNTDIWLRHRLEHPHGVLHVAEADGLLVGSGFVRFDGSQAFLDDFFVRSPGRGVGSRLLEVSLDLARSWGCASVWCLAVAVDRVTLRFLHAHGFAVSGMDQSDVVPGAMTFRYEKVLRPLPGGSAPTAAGPRSA